MAAVPEGFQVLDRPFEESLEGPDGEVGEGDGGAALLTRRYKEDQGLAGDRDRQQDQISRQRVVTDIVLGSGRNAIDLIPEDFGVVGSQPDMQAGQSVSHTGLLDG